LSVPRLKTHIRAAAVIRRAEAAGVFATVARRGDRDAGSIALKVFIGRNDAGLALARLLYEARTAEGDHEWRDPFDSPDSVEIEEKRVDEWIAREIRFDPDIWVIEIEDREGRSFTD
jgi:hypothetical protein